MDKKETTSLQGRASSPDRLTKTGKKGDVELPKDDLKTVSGGAPRVLFTTETAKKG